MQEQSEFRILAPLAMLGYGYPPENFAAGLEQNPHAICVDAGSTDGGPHKLGKGVGIVTRQSTKRDLTPMLAAVVDRHIPLIVGSCGGSGGRVHLEATADVVAEILGENDWNHLKVVLIDADVEPAEIKRAIEEGRITPLPGVHDLKAEIADGCSGSIVAQMGVEPIIAALDGNADIILCGRAYDPAVFAAPAIRRGFDAGLSLHLGKILECGAMCAVPGSGSDCMIGTVERESFTVTPVSLKRRCTTLSVASHTLYEKSDPAHLAGPGGELDLSGSVFEQVDDRTVRVTGSRFIPSSSYTIKLEGAAIKGYRSVCIAGVRDPGMIAALDECIAYARAAAERYAGGDGAVCNVLVYGRDAVLGERDPKRHDIPHEVGLVIEGVAGTQDAADTVCSVARSSLLHYHYSGRKGTSGNLAFPFAPSDFPAGPVFEFVIYHLMTINDPLSAFPIRQLNCGVPT